MVAALGVLAICTAVVMSVSQFRAMIVPRLTGIMPQYLEGNIKLGRHLAATRAAAKYLINRLGSDSRYAWSSIQFGDGSSFFVYERVSSAGQ